MSINAVPQPAETTQSNITAISEAVRSQPMPTLTLVAFSTGQINPQCPAYPTSEQTAISSSSLSVVQATQSPLPSAHAHYKPPVDQNQNVAKQIKYSSASPGSSGESMTSPEYGAVDLSARALHKSRVSTASQPQQPELTSLATSARPSLQVIISE